MHFKTILKPLFALPFLLLGASQLYGQDQPVAPPAEGTGDTLANAVGKLQNDVEALKRIKVSGYLQAEFQYADSNGINSYAGGNFAPGQDKRFLLRRGRVKVAYTTALTQAVVQIDATPAGVSTIEAYAVVTEPWMRSFCLPAGIFSRPFGYEVPYSSSLRESPERGRMSQIIFPGERDLGAMLTFQMPKESNWSWFKIQGGMFNGTGRTTNDYDTQKDFIGQLIISRSNKKENFKYSGGVSYYSGGERQFGKKVESMGVEINGDAGFLIDSSASNIGKYARRQYMGVDLQLSYDWIAGTTTIRGEYISGKQPGTSASSASFTTAAPSTVEIYDREFNGAYFYFTQNIMQSKHQIVVKYDWYDPNTKIAGEQIKGGATKTGVADIKYSTLGIGYIFHWDHNVKLVLYYDIVTNESTKIAGYTHDVKDNVVTARLQYRF